MLLLCTPSAPNTGTWDGQGNVDFVYLLRRPRSKDTLDYTTCSDARMQTRRPLQYTSKFSVNHGNGVLGKRRKRRVAGPLHDWDRTSLANLKKKFRARLLARSWEHDYNGRRRNQQRSHNNKLETVARCRPGTVAQNTGHTSSTGLTCRNIALASSLSCVYTHW